MRRIILILAMLIGVLSPIMAQHNGSGKSREQMRKEIEEFKIQFITKKMELSAEQKEKFVPLYTKMSEERFKKFREIRKLEKRISKSKNASDSEYEAVTKAIREAKQKDAEIESNYEDQFSKFLSAKQIFKMHEAENEFMDRMRKMGKEKKKHDKANRR